MSIFKKSVIGLAGATGAVAAGAALVRRSHPGGYVRVVNYHGTPLNDAESLDRHFRYFAAHYVPVGPAELAALLHGHWSAPRPGIAVTFDDGLRSNLTVAAPLLARYGLTGWFFVPAGVIDAAVEGAPGDQPRLAAGHSIRIPPDEAPGRCFMDWVELRDLAQRHVVGCHTMNHTRLPPGTDEVTVQREVSSAKALLGIRLERSIDAFCWVGGEEANYSRAAAQAVEACGFRWAFMSLNAPVTPRTDPLHLHRTRLEPSWPLSWVEFYLSGLLDFARAPARRRVDEMTTATLL